MNYSEAMRFIEATHRHPSWPRIYCYGDSWFQYPFKSVDLQKQIERLFRRQALFVNDSEAGRESAALKQRLPGLRARLGEWEIDLLLVSMGGNDVVGSELREFLKPKDEPQSGAPDWPPDTPQVALDHVRLSAFAQALNFLADDVHRVLDTRDAVAPHCHVLLNSYDYPFADGRGFKKGFIVTRPWMKPHFDAVRLTDPAKQRELSVWLIDQFVGRLQHLASSSALVQVVDARGQLSSKRQWENEIHPTAAGFHRIAKNCWSPAIQALLATL